MAEAERLPKVPRGDIISYSNSLQELVDLIRDDKDIPAHTVKGALASLLILLSTESRDDALYSLLAIPGIDTELTEGADSGDMFEKEIQIENLSSDLEAAYFDHIETLTGVIIECESADRKEELGRQLLATLCDLHEVRKFYHLTP